MQRNLNDLPAWLGRYQKRSVPRLVKRRERLEPNTNIRHAAFKKSPSLVARVAKAGVLGVFAFTLSGAGFIFHDIYSSISESTINIADFTNEEKAQTPVDNFDGRAVNIMVLGIDTRHGAGNEQFGAEEGLLNDTNFLMHISADRKRLQMISIPRDTLVDIPACRLRSGDYSLPQYGQFNWALGIGSEHDPENLAPGIACVKNTMEELTGIEIDEFMMIDFSGFQSIIDALGGVEMCFESDLFDPKSALDLKAGCHTLDGFTALGYARTRSLADDPTGDIGRMGRQQQLVGRILQTAKQKNFFTDFPKLYAFAKEGIRSVKASPQLTSLTNATGLAYSLSAIPDSGIQFATMPWGQAPTDPNRVVPSELAPAFWESIRKDQPFPDGTEMRDLSGNVSIVGENRPEDGSSDNVGNTGEHSGKSGQFNQPGQEQSGNTGN